MANNPYAGYYQPPEYNVNGDSANGQVGSQQPGAVMNRATQAPAPGSKNPYAEILNYLPKQTSGGYNGLPQHQAFGATLTPASPERSPLGGMPTALTPSGAPGAPTTGQGTQPGYPYAGGPVLAPSQPGAPTAGQGNATPPTGQGYQFQGNQGNATPPTGGAPKPQGTEDPTIAAKWYATFPGFEGVTANDVTAYRNNPQGMDFAGWWNAGHGPDPHAGQEMTYVNGVPTWTATQTPPQAQPTTPGPTPTDFDERGQPNAWTIPASTPTPTATAPPTGTATPGTATPSTTPTPQTPAGTASPATTPFVSTPTSYDERGQPKTWSTPPPGAPGAPQGPKVAVGHPPMTPAGGSPPGAPGGPGALNDPQALVKVMQTLMGPQFQTEQSDLARNMNANAALTGDINSGGYGEQFGRNMSRLIGTQGQTLAGMTQAQSLQAQQLASQQSIAQMQNETAKLGIDIQKYGIDQTRLSAKEVAQIHAAAAQAGAMASAGASAAAANAGLQGVLASIAEHQQISLATLGLDKFKYENPSANTLIAAYLGMSPEQMASAFSGNNLNFPQFGYQPPPSYKP